MKTTPQLTCICCLFILFSTNLSGQTCTYDTLYEDPEAWTLWHTGENLPNLPQHPGPGNIFVDNNRVKMHRLSGGGHDKRIYRTIPALSGTWTVEFDMRIVDANPFFSPGAFWHTLLALTVGNQIPLTNLVFPFDYDNPQFINSEQDGIVVELRSVGSTSSVHVFINDNGNITDACSVVLPWNLANIIPRNGSIRLENFGNGFGQLTVKKTNGDLIGQCCFSIDNNFDNLTHIQHGNSPIPGWARYVTGGIGNLCITDGSTVNLSCVDGQSEEFVAGNEPFSMDIFPNPVNDILTIQIHSSGKAATNWNVHIFDMQGRLLMQKFFVNGDGLHQRIDISSLPVGSYAILVQNADGEFSDQKVLIKQ